MTPTAALGRIWLVGCGAMGGAMLSRWLATGLDPERVTVIDPALPDVPQVRVVALAPAGPLPNTVMLGVKPQMLDVVTAAVTAMLGPETLLLSILAGTTHAALAARFGPGVRIVRVMPNLPVTIGLGAVALFGPGVERPPLNAAFGPLGLVEWIDDEANFDAVTALSGSGPAFVYRFIEALTDGGVALGLTYELANRLARATAAGAAMLASQSSEPLEMLADRVASKGGSTREGLDVLDVDAVLMKLVEAALQAAAARNRALAISAG